MKKQWEHFSLPAPFCSFPQTWISNTILYIYYWHIDFIDNKNNNWNINDSLPEWNSTCRYIICSSISHHIQVTCWNPSFLNSSLVSCKPPPFLSNSQQFQSVSFLERYLSAFHSIKASHSYILSPNGRSLLSLSVKFCKELWKKIINYKNDQK